MEKEKNNSQQIWISYYDDNFIEQYETKQQIPIISRGHATLKDIRNGFVFLQTPENLLMIPIHRVLKIKRSLKINERGIP